MIEAQLQHSSISESQEATAFLVPNKSLVCCSLLQSACWGQPAVEGLRLHCHSLHFTLLVLQHRLYMSLWCVFRSLTAQMVRLVLQGGLVLEQAWCYSKANRCKHWQIANKCPKKGRRSGECCWKVWKDKATTRPQQRSTKHLVIIYSWWGLKVTK